MPKPQRTGDAGAWPGGAGDAAEGRASWKPDFDYAGVFASRCAEGCGGIGGQGNTFGHPRYEVIERIAEAQTRLYRTDEFGLTTFLLGRDGGIREIVGCDLISEAVELIGRVSMELNETSAEVAAISAEERAEEQKLIRRLQMMMNMVMQVIAQDATLTVDDAAQMIADSRKAALAMFPGKELAYDLIWRPRFQRLMRERFRIM